MVNEGATCIGWHLKAYGLAGGAAVFHAMIIGALSFTMLMGLMCVSLGKAMWRDHLRETKSPG